MSVLKMSEVWNLDLPPNEKLVAMRLADRCDEDGENVFYAVRTIAAACSMTDRNVQLILVKLLEKGVIEVRARATRYRPTVYKLNTDRALMAAAAERNKAEIATRKRLDASRKGKAIRGEEGFTPAEEPIRGEAGFTPAPLRGEGDFTPEAARGEAGFVSGVKPASPDPYRDPKNQDQTPGDAVASRGAQSILDELHDRKPLEPAKAPIQSELLDEFDTLHRAEFKDPATREGVPLHITRGKDARNIRDLVRKDGADEVRSRWRSFLKIRGDRFLESNGYTVSTFLMRYAGLARKTRAPARSGPPQGKFAQVDRVVG